MSVTILTKNGIENSNISAARDFNFNSGGQSGIMQGALNEGEFYASSSNIIALDSCELRISGHRVVIDEPYLITMSNIPVEDTIYSMIAEIVVDSEGDVTFRLFIQPASVALTQNDLFANTTGAGTYQIKIGNFTLTTGGVITNVERVCQVLTNRSYPSTVFRSWT